MKTVYVLKCYLTSSEGLRAKGVEAVVDCVVSEVYDGDIARIRELVLGILGRILAGGPGLGELSFDSNESIGSTHMLYRFRYRVDPGSEDYIGARVVVRGTSIVRVLFTFPRRLGGLISIKEVYDPSEELSKGGPRENTGAPGQVYIPGMVIYNILGVPRVDASGWSLEVSGLVSNPVKLSLSGLYELGVETIRTDFHCVTGWSVKNLEFTGVRLSKIVELVKPRESVKWVYVESLDGYTTIFPFNEVTRGDGLVALEMNGKPLDILHGYPARLIIPSLYGWKSAKWVSRIMFTDEYRDGYWEALGYHPRGRVDLEERFKML